ncbi:MAG: hypothetical protein K0Q95_906 [Bacteroidota bacterium]|jgi:hypothetical protein|nr:hypothetical protein [Bacteroidota bacterium]
MRTSQQWLEHFEKNLEVRRIDWNIAPAIKKRERDKILNSSQAWQLGETSEGRNLLHASTLYSNRIGDPVYPKAVSLFIKEEQKHGNNLGKYLDLIGEKRIQKDWGDSLFRKIRYFNSSMELWTLAVITVESTAQLFYQSLKDATGCVLLKQICTDILIDEASHIDFQFERFFIIYQNKSLPSQLLSIVFYTAFYFATILVVWFAHKKAFKAGGNNFRRYWLKMSLKYKKTIGRLNKTLKEQKNVKTKKSSLVATRATNA